MAGCQSTFDEKPNLVAVAEGRGATLAADELELKPTPESYRYEFYRCDEFTFNLKVGVKKAFLYHSDKTYLLHSHSVEGGVEYRNDDIKLTVVERRVNLMFFGVGYPDCSRL